jgi:hypothetical protein
LFVSSKVNLSNCWGATDGLPTLLTVLVGLLETSWDTNCFLNNNNGPLESYKYLDSKPVYMLSTKHGSSLSTTSRRNRITNEIVVMYSNYHNTDYNLCQRNLSSCPWLDHMLPH